MNTPIRISMFIILFLVYMPESLPNDSKKISNESSSKDENIVSLYKRVMLNGDNDLPVNKIYYKPCKLEIKDPKTRAKIKNQIFQNNDKGFVTKSNDQLVAFAVLCRGKPPVLISIRDRNDELWVHPMKAKGTLLLHLMDGAGNYRVSKILKSKELIRIFYKELKASSDPISIDRVRRLNLVYKWLGKVEKEVPGEL